GEREPAWPRAGIHLEAAQDAPGIAGKAVPHGGSDEPDALQQFAHAAGLVGMVKRVQHSLRQLAAARLGAGRWRKETQVRCQFRKSAALRRTFAAGFA